MGPATCYRRVLLVLGISSGAGSMLCCGGTARATIPDTPPGHALRAWLNAYNAADSAGLEAYARRYDPGMSVHTQLVFRDQTGVFELASVERSETYHVEVILRSAHDSMRPSRTATVMYAILDSGDGLSPRASVTLTRVGSVSDAVRSMTSAERAKAIDSLIAKVRRNYLFPEVAARIADSLRAMRERGVYDHYPREISFAHRLNGDLVALGRDPQLGVEYAWRVPLPLPVPAPPAMRTHCGFEPPLILDASVGYVVFYGFRDPAMDCGNEVSKAMNAVAGSRALIIDFRENKGGSRTMMAYLASYLVEDCTHLSDVRNRRTNHTEESWTLDGLPGPAFGGTKPLFILTSPRTSSAAEELAYALQALGRATIVGEATAGTAYLTALGQIGEHLLLRVPVARTINPVTGTNWEGGGVRPDTTVAARDALATARSLVHRGQFVRSAAPMPLLSRVRAPQSASEPAGGGMPSALQGIRFSVDTMVAQSARGLLTRVNGVAKFANGRGRFDVVAVRHDRPVSLNGITVTDPLAKAGDYYLFDNSGFILVRPAARTFSSFVFTRADFNTTGDLLPGAFMMMDVPLHTDTLVDEPTQRGMQHAPVSIHWHMQPPGGDAMYARGWLEIRDAPAEEAGVARWFEVAAALATRPGGVSAVAARGLEVTSVVLLRRPAVPEYKVRYMEMLLPRDLSEARIDPRQLMLPRGYVETPLPHLVPVPGPRAPSLTNAARWRQLESPSSQRARATCRAPWLPDLAGGTRTQ